MQALGDGMPPEGMPMSSEAWREIIGGSNVEPIRKRGTRWPMNAAVPEEWIEAGYRAREQAGLPRIDIRLEAQKFVDHFVSMSGARAAKLNWQATWRNWCRNAYTGKPEEKPTKPGISDIVEQSRARAKLAARGLRASLLDRADLERGVREGILTVEQAKRFGF